MLAGVGVGVLVGVIVRVGVGVLVGVGVAVPKGVNVGVIVRVGVGVGVTVELPNALYNTSTVHVPEFTVALNTPAPETINPIGLVSPKSVVVVSLKEELVPFQTLAIFPARILAPLLTT